MLVRLRDAQAFDRSDPATRRALVMERLRDVIRVCLASAPLYHRDRDLLERLVAEREPERFFAMYAEVQPLTKDDLASRFDEIITDPELDLARVRAFDEGHADGLGVLRTARGEHQAIKTSGTSGQLVYIVDQVAVIKQVMSLLLFRSLFRVLWQRGLWPVMLPLLRPWYRLVRRLRRPRVSGHRPPTRYRPPLAERIARFFKPSILVFVHRGNRSVYRGTTSKSQPRLARLLLHVRVISHEESLERILAQAQWQAPEFLFGLPSRIEWLARAQLRGELAIDPLGVYVGGETLHAELRALFQEAWPDAVVINTYGATETKAIALACPECGELHVCEDIVHLELQADDGGPAPDGTPAARIFATGLWNKTVPVLRYAMSDRIVPLPDAGCRWRTRRIQVWGREPAFLWVQRSASSEWLPLNGRMLKERLVAIPEARGFMVRHQETRSIALTFVVDTLDDAVRTAVEAQARASLEALAEDAGARLETLFDEVTVTVQDLDAWNRAGGKLGSIVSTVDPRAAHAPIVAPSSAPVDRLEGERR